MESVINDVTIQAYLGTHFNVHGATPTTLHIGEANATLLALQSAAHVASSAYITACNPHSQPFDSTTNNARHAALAAELHAQGLTFVHGVGEHPSGSWRGEDSLLVFGLSLESTRTLGTKYQQNAVVWCDADAVPLLVLLR